MAEILYKQMTVRFGTSGQPVVSTESSHCFTLLFGSSQMPSQVSTWKDQAVLEKQQLSEDLHSIYFFVKVQPG